MGRTFESVWQGVNNIADRWAWSSEILEERGLTAS